MGYGGASNHGGFGGGFGGAFDSGSAMPQYSTTASNVGGGGGGSLSYIESGPPILKGGGSSFGNPIRDPFSTSSSQSDPFTPMGQPPKASGHAALKWDARTGKMQAGTDIGEEPLPGNRMTDEECRRHGLPKGSLWLDEDAAKSKPHPLFDPGRERISWDELPTGLSEAMATNGNGVPQQTHYNYGQIPQSDSQPRALSLGDDESKNQLISLQHQLGGAGRLGNIPIGVLANMSQGPNPTSNVQSNNFSASNLLNINNEQSRMMSGLHGDSSASWLQQASVMQPQQLQSMNIFGTPSMDATRMAMQGGNGWVGGGPGQSYMNNGARSPAMQPLSAKSPGPMFAGAGNGGMGAGVNGSMAGQHMQGFTGLGGMGMQGMLGMQGGSQGGMNASGMGAGMMGMGGMNSVMGSAYGGGSSYGGGGGMGPSMGGGGAYGGAMGGMGAGGFGMTARGYGGFGPGRQV